MRFRYFDSWLRYAFTLYLLIVYFIFNARKLYNTNVKLHYNLMIWYVVLYTIGYRYNLHKNIGKQVSNKQ